MDLASPWKIFGHEPIKRILDKQLAKRKFPHAYLFVGASGVGKKTLALEFAKKILCTENLQNHPDFQILDQEGEITVERTLEYISKLAFKPFAGEKKVAVMANAQNFNTQSANALLKTLEEPSESSIIILIADTFSSLPTIVSRCQVFNFNAFSLNQLKEYAEVAGLKPSQEVSDLSFGQISRLNLLSKDEDAFLREKANVEGYRKLEKMGLGEKMLAVNEYAESDPSELEKQSHAWLGWQISQLKDNPQNFQKLQGLSDFITGLKQNKNKKLLLQSLFLKI